LAQSSTSIPRFQPVHRTCAGKSGSSKFKPRPPHEVLAGFLSDTVEQMADQGRIAVNQVLTQTGSKTEFRKVNNNIADERPADCNSVDDMEVKDSHFWCPYSKGSPFVVGRQAFLAQFKDVKGPIVSEQDLEQYVDCMINDSVLSSNAVLPGSRQLYIRTVHIVLKCIHTICLMAEDQEILGQRLRLIKQPSKLSKLSGSSAMPLDQKVVSRLARRVFGDHDAALTMGLPEPLALRLHEDIIALTFRLLYDIVLTFQVRCLGHSIRCEISVDSMIHKAPGWDVALEQGAFGKFDDIEKRRWVDQFIEDMLLDEEVGRLNLPAVVEKRMFTTSMLILLNLVETAANHFRIHVAGISLRPVLVDMDSDHLGSDPRASL